MGVLVSNSIPFAGQWPPPQLCAVLRAHSCRDSGRGCSLSELTPGARGTRLKLSPSMSWLSHLPGPVPHHPTVPAPARPSLCISRPELLPPTPLEGQLKQRLFSHRLEARRLRWRCGQAGSLRGLSPWLADGRPLLCPLVVAFLGPLGPGYPSVCPNPSSYKDTSLPDGFVLTDSSLKRACLQVQPHSERLGLYRVNSGESDSHHSAWDWDNFPTKSLSKQPPSQALFLRQDPPSFLLLRTGRGPPLL